MMRIDIEDVLEDSSLEEEGHHPRLLGVSNLQEIVALSLARCADSPEHDRGSRADADILASSGEQLLQGAPWNSMPGREQRSGEIVPVVCQVSLFGEGDATVSYQTSRYPQAGSAYPHVMHKKHF